MVVERSVSLQNWMQPPFNREAFRQVRQVVPTAPIRRDPAFVTNLPARPAALEGVVIDGVDGRRVGLIEHLERTYCDAICVVHDGAVVFERYSDGMTPNDLHLLMSVSKTVTGAMLGVSIGAGRLSASDLVCAIAPEFRGRNLDGATVQHLIDMTAGVEFVEDYDLYDQPDSDAPLIEYERQAGYRPLGERTPIGVLAHFGTYPHGFEHGSRFDYRSPLTNVVARVLEEASGLRFPELVAHDLWGPLGQEHDADVMLDPTGFPVMEGGMSATVRDLARLGLAYLDEGVVGGRQVIPAEWIADTWFATDHHVDLFAHSEYAHYGWSHYRNGLWVFERGAVGSGLGIFGQFCWVHRPTRTVIARFSTTPGPLDELHVIETLGAFETIATSL